MCTVKSTVEEGQTYSMPGGEYNRTGVPQWLKRKPEVTVKRVARIPGLAASGKVGEEGLDRRLDVLERTIKAHGQGRRVRGGEAHDFRLHLEMVLLYVRRRNVPLPTAAHAASSHLIRLG